MSASHTAVVAEEAAITAVLDEITVTARKRTESLQDAPLSVTAFGEAALEARSIDNISGLAGFTPNLEINNGRGDSGSTNAAVFIRGVGQNDFIFPSDPGVGIYVDGVYVARSLGAMMEMNDIERIEVLRGPQGTLYGKNTIGGAINVITSRPRQELSGMVKATTGSRDRIDLDARINLPIVEDKLAAKIAVASHNQDGYVTRQTDGLDLGDRNLDALRGALAWNVSETFTLDLTADYSRVRQNGAPGVLRGTFSDPTGLHDLYNILAAPYIAARDGLPAGSLFNDEWVPDNPYKESYGTGPSYDRNDTWGANLTANWELSDSVSVKSITAYRDMDIDIAVDMDYSPFPIVHTMEEQSQHQFSQELQFSGNAVDGKLEWLVGAYYLRERAEDMNQTLLGSGIFDVLEMLPGAVVPLVPGVTCPTVGAPCAGGAGNPFNAALDLDVSPTTALTTNNWAAFAHMTYDVTPDLALTVGGRWSYEKKTYFIDSVFPNSGKVATPPTTDSQNWDKFTPKLGLDYRVNEDVLLYASWSKGFKSGGWNPRPLQPAEFRRYAPENLTAYEVGMKSRLLDNRMTLNVAGFYSQYRDVQLISNSVSPDNGSLVITLENAGDVDLYGFEAEIVARPVAGLDLNLGVGYLHNEYERLDSSVGYSPANKLPQAPEWTLNAGIQYTHMLPNDGGSLLARLDGSYRSKTYHDPQNSLAITEGGYGLLNLRIAYTSPDEVWQLAGFVTNLMDEEYYTSAEYVPSFGFYNGVVGRPREWGLSLSANF
jgi:iron complex outermembrane receptor protein